MRPAPLAVVSLVAAICGGVLVLAVGKGLGWLDDEGTTTVVVARSTVAAHSAAAEVHPAGRPLAWNGFDPARIYRLRSAGVVTIYAYFGDSQAGEAQGSGFVASRSGYIL